MPKLASIHAYDDNDVSITITYPVPAEASAESLADLVNVGLSTYLDLTGDRNEGHLYIGVNFEGDPEPEPEPRWTIMHHMKTGDVLRSGSYPGDYSTVEADEIIKIGEGLNIKYSKVAT